MSATSDAGGTVTVHGDGFMPGTDVDVTLHSTPVQLGTFTTDATGSFTADVTIPTGTTPGAHTIVLTGTAPNGQPATVDLALTVPDSTLPYTGGSPFPFAALGVLLIAAGALMVRGRRPRTAG
jgi:alpha-L-fucosidase